MKAIASCVPMCTVSHSPESSFVSLVYTILPQLVGAIGKSKKTYVVCCQPGAKADFGSGVRGASDVRDINAKNLPPAKTGDVVVVVTPVRQRYRQFRRMLLAQGFTHPEICIVSTSSRNSSSTSS